MTLPAHAAAEPPASLTAALRDELPRRRARIRAVLRQHGVPVLVIPCGGAPNGDGWLRYMTAGQMWGGHGLIVVDARGGPVTVALRSTYDEAWLTETAVGTRPVSTQLQRRAPVDHVVDLIAGPGGGPLRVGIANTSLVTEPDARALRRVGRLVDLTQPLARLRRTKSRAEVAAITHTGRLLAAACEVLAEEARPGRRLAHVAGDVDGFLRGVGCTWGWTTYALVDGSHARPAPPGHRLRARDVLAVRLAHCGPTGYWHVASAVVPVGPLGIATQTHLHRLEGAIERATLAARRGAPRSTIGAAARAAWPDRRAAPTLRVHALGTDEEEAAALGRVDASTVLAVTATDALPTARTIVVRPQRGVSLSASGPRSRALISG